jgi:DNA-binding beta-propeller fold protein YncE
MSLFLNERESKLFNVNELYPHKFNTVTLSPDGTFLLVNNHEKLVIDKICLKTGQLSTFAGVPYRRGITDGPKEQALFDGPLYITFSPDGLFVLVCDVYSHCIRKICLKSGQVSTFAGTPLKRGSRNGPKEQALFYGPRNLTFSKNGKYVLVCDTDNHCIRKICLQSGQVSTFAGVLGYGGVTNSPSTRFLYPTRCVFSFCGTFVLVADSGAYIRKICLKTLNVTKFFCRSQFKVISHIALCPDNKYALICDHYNHCIRKICFTSGQVSTFAGIFGEKGLRNGPKEQDLFSNPKSLTFKKCVKFIIIFDKNNIKYMKIK